VRNTTSTATPSCSPSGRRGAEKAGAADGALCQTARVFGHRHRDEELAERIDHLMAGVFVADDGERMETLTRHVAPDLVYVSPEAVFEGPPGLSDAFARYRNEREWRTSLRRTSPVDLHHGYFRYTWERMERGATAMEGWSFGSLDETGAICRVVTFEGLVPGQPDSRS
jgi:hypothetical protein